MRRLVLIALAAAAASLVLPAAAWAHAALLQTTPVASRVVNTPPKEVALRSVTLAPAQIFGVADKVGSLETGKLANIIVTDGDPLEIVTHVRRLFIGGEEITLDTNQTLLYEKFRLRP